jgi:hypothetical protein
MFYAGTHAFIPAKSDRVLTGHRCINGCQKPAGVTGGPLVRKPTLFGESIADGLVDLRPPCPEAGLRQVLSDGLPTLRFAAGNADIEQYERSDIVKGPEDACASGSSRIHFDRLKFEFAHRIQNTAE